MQVQINNISLKNINIAFFNDCELSLTFSLEHEYSSIEEIQEVLNQVGLSIGNFFFKGVSMLDYYLPTGEISPILPLLLDDKGRTDLLCVIPQNLRGRVQITTIGD